MNVNDDGDDSNQLAMACLMTADVRAIPAATPRPDPQGGLRLVWVASSKSVRVEAVEDRDAQFLVGDLRVRGADKTSDRVQTSLAADHVTESHKAEREHGHKR